MSGTPPVGNRQANCSVEECDRLAHVRGWCGMHYQRWWNHGDPLVKERGGPARRDPAERFFEKVDLNGPDGCWLWTAGTSSDGYGGFMSSTGRVVRAHRWAYEHLVGSIPEGLDLDHLCRVRRCVNPAHLEPVTRLENTLRGLGHGSEMHCPHGHPYDDENTYVYAGRRACRTCRIEHRRRYVARKRKAGSN